MFTVKKRMEIAGAHRLNLNYESKCANLHGHNWIVTIWCRSEKLNENGMVIDFTHIKRLIHDRLDHKCLNDEIAANPTAENIAQWIVSQIPQAFKCEVQESEGNVACYERD
jgi:6-pyruvoyltetrahydropterin/6-carboxytetrahydropterin synthase